MTLSNLVLTLVLGLQPLPDSYLATRTCNLALTVLDGGADAEEAARLLHVFGAAALPSVREAMQGQRVDSLTAVPLLEFFALYGDAQSHAMIRPLVFSREPTVAALAIRAFVLAAGARSVPILENVVAGDAPFAQKLAALEGLEAAGLHSSFRILTDYAEEAANDPILRAEAARIVAELDMKKTQKWLKKLSLPATTNPFVRAQLDLLAVSLQDRALQDAQRGR